MNSAIGRLLLVAALEGLLTIRTGGESLEAGFRIPPDSARPRTWWHWTGGNITKEGITKDLEWMKRVGIGGAQVADVSAGRGQSVETKIEFGSPEWLDALRHAASEAKRLGLELSLFSSAGWSETGGPWVKPEQAMKKLVWSQTVVQGPGPFAGKLALPPTNNGPVGNLRGGSADDPTFYADCAAIAFPTPGTETNMAELKPKVTSNQGVVDGAALLDDDLNSALILPAPADRGPAWVQFEFEQPFTARALRLAGRGGIPVGRVMAGDDGVNFQTLVTLPGTQLYRQGQVRTFAFPETAAKFFRIEMTGAPLNPAATMSQSQPEPARQYVMTEAKFFSGARVHRAEEKAGFSFLFEYDSAPTPAVSPNAAVPRMGVVDLTSKMSADGSLAWEIPEGRWTILRLGCSLTGSKNRPARPGGLGYEADKLSRKHIEAYYHGYLDPVARALGPLFGASLKYVTMDSWEAGMQNWTDDMLSEFQQRRGYDPRPYLPALTGSVVENADVSDRFLWDFRRTLADLWADAHYGTMTELLHKDGLGTYGEAAGVSLEIPEDTLLNKSRVDIPMGEFWVRDLHPHLMYLQDVRGAASASHVYGKQLVAAEAFTGGGYESPFTLKKVGDYWFGQGVNRFVFHTSAHQPLDTKPGNTMVGTHLHRNITWAEEAKPYMDYLARSCYMLQQGRFVADLAYLLNEGAPSTMPIWGDGVKPAPPPGYDYDYINADVLLHRMTVAEDGRLVLPDGMSYRVLVLPENSRMRPELLRKIRDLVAGGATVVGQRPEKSPSLSGYPNCDTEVLALAAEVWGDLDGVSRTIRSYGKGRVAWGRSLETVFAALKVVKDFDYARGLDADVAWLHRKDAGTDIYFVANLSDQARDFEARFRVAGKAAELWHPDSGETEPADYRIVEDRTTVPLRLAGRESVFVVFRQPTPVLSRSYPPVSLVVLGEAKGPWRLDFPPNLGAPASIQMKELQSWTKHTNSGVKYFSGTCTYSTSIEIPKRWVRPHRDLFLDLGEVKDLAEVVVNDQSLGILWKPPYRVQVTRALKPGKNRVNVRVTDEWTNRLLGDRAVPSKERVLAPVPEGPGGPGRGFAQTLPEAGLMGPVKVLAGEPGMSHQQSPKQEAREPNERPDGG